MFETEASNIPPITSPVVSPIVVRRKRGRPRKVQAPNQEDIENVATE